MAEITASMVMNLRGQTDAPMMDCKKALIEAEGERCDFSIFTFLKSFFPVF